MGYFSELDAEGPYRTCGEADEAHQRYPEEYRMAARQPMAPDKRFWWNGDDWDIYVSIDGDEPQYIGSAPTRPLAEQRASEYVIAYYEDRHTPETAATLILAGV